LQGVMQIKPLINCRSYTDFERGDKLCLIIKCFKKVFLNYVLVSIAGFFGISNNAAAFELSEITATPSIAVSQSYDDNITYATGDEKSDFVTRITPAISAQYDAKDYKWNMYADVTQDIFARYNKFDNMSEHIGLNADIELSKHDRISLSEKFAHTYEPATFDQTFARTLGRYSYYTNDIAVEYIRDLNRQLSVHTLYANEIDLISSSGMSDSALNKLAVQLDYVFSASTTYSTEVMFARRDFDPGSHKNQLRWDAATLYNFSKLTNVKITAGIDDFMTQSKDYVRPVFIVLFDHQVGKKASASLSLTKQYELNSYSQELFDCWRLASYSRYHFTRKITGGLGVYYGQGTYVESRIDETFIGSEISCQYELAKDTMIDCTYAFTQNSSKNADREYTKNKVSFGFKKEF
jgi:hypothetical protein